VDERIIVENIRKLRQSKGVSVEQLGKLARLTKGYVSKIENSQKAPPFSTLAKIADALCTDLTVLIAEGPEAAEARDGLCLVRKNERKGVISRGTLYGYHYEALAHKKAGKNMEPLIIEPAFREKKDFSHEGEEFMYVLEGKLEFFYGQERYILEEGDSIYYDSIIPHGGKSIGEHRAKVLTVLYSYKR